ncbi:SRPBCC family protein [Undibacterium terreum]|uniref:Activator of HSP90 ATPase n=1 Tax=Undibacterium terreum TaxID=1224302 RepID=A0A916XR44_9BURK|nr:SRPBCC domain-containing protein [Undibacterium terreum]GGC98792.1 activator of HSP90 ATPase [Undibacterium terreum]
MPNIVHRIGIRAPISTVYAAVSTIEGIAGWWTRDTSGESRLGGSIQVHFRTPSREEIGKMGFELSKLDVNKEVHWHFTSGPEEWLGTDVTFSLSQEGDCTLILFGHRNWREEVEFMAHCSMKWATFLLSLKLQAEAGKGKPAPDDMKIDNWN